MRCNITEWLLEISFLLNLFSFQKKERKILFHKTTMLLILLPRRRQVDYAASAHISALKSCLRGGSIVGIIMVF